MTEKYTVNNAMCIICNQRLRKRGSYCVDCDNEKRRQINSLKKKGIFVRKYRPKLTEEQAIQSKIRIRQKAQKRNVEFSEINKLYNKQYRANNAEAIAEHKRDALKKARIDGFICSCCGESNEKFLTLEHLLGRKKDKQVPQKSGKAWLRLRALGYPTENYTLLCFNCNCAKGIYGKCPHQELKERQ